MNIRHILGVSIISALLLHSQQSFAELIATCYDNQGKFAQCKGNSNLSSVSILRGTLVTKDLPTMPANANGIANLGISLTPLEAKFTVMSPTTASLSQMLYFECAITPAENPLLFQTASTIIASSSTGLDSENSYYTKNNLTITRDANKRCTNLAYGKYWVK